MNDISVSLPRKKLGDLQLLLKLRKIRKQFGLSRLLVKILEFYFLNPSKRFDSFILLNIIDWSKKMR